MYCGVKVAAQGRVTIPTALHTRRGLKTGDTLLAHLDDETAGVRLAKAINPFDLLFGDAIRRYHAGKTIGLREFLARAIDEPGGDDEQEVRNGTEWRMVGETP